MRIYKRKDRPYYFIDYINSAGERVRESTGTSNKKTAEEILAKRRTEVIEGKFGIEKPKKITFNEVLDKFFESQKLLIKPSTLERYKFSAEKLRPFFGEMFLDSIKLLDIEKYRQERAKKVSTTTVNRDVEVIRRLFNVAKKWGMVQKNPVEDIEFYKEDNIRTRFLSKVEVKRLLDECRGLPYLHLIVMIAIHTGMRKAEILALRIPREGEPLDKVNWIDIKNRCFHLNDTKTGHYRSVPLNKILFPLVKSAVKKASGEFLFDLKSIRTAFENALKRAEIKDAIFHDLRRTFISHAMMAGYSQEVIQRIVGQEDPTIFKRYAHLSPDMRMQVIEEVGRIFTEDED